jgi:hypothetical protein
MGETQRLKLRTKAENEVKFQHIIDYKLFKKKFGEDREELITQEKFYAIRMLIDSGHNQIYVNADISTQENDKTQKETKVDVCGIHENSYTLVLCETDLPTVELYKKLELLTSIKNTEIILIYPFTIDTTTVLNPLPSNLVDRLSIEQIPWLDEDLESTFQEAIKFINLLTNQTRVKMLLPLLRQTRRKSDYREQINPKLVYENIANLTENNLLRELSRNEYCLTPIGKQILGEYLAFIQRIKKTLREYKR